MSARAIFRFYKILDLTSNDTMMRDIFPPELYRFLQYTNERAPEKSILDCGAGGNKPPLALFHSHGYKTKGVDISLDQIKRADEYARRNGISLGIHYADMRDLPYDDCSFGCVYSWSSSVHLTKVDTAKAVSEMLRVLKPSGLLYVNFVWDIVKNHYPGEERSPGEIWFTDGDIEWVHSMFSQDEPDLFFVDCNFYTSRVVRGSSLMVQRIDLMHILITLP